MFSSARVFVRLCIIYLRKWGVLEFLEFMWPMFATPIVVALAIWTGYLRVGMGILFAIFCLQRYWWSCIFGLLDVIALMGGGIVCLVTYAQQMRDAALQQLP